MQSVYECMHDTEKQKERGEENKTKACSQNGLKLPELEVNNYANKAESSTPDSGMMVARTYSIQHKNQQTHAGEQTKMIQP